MADCQRYGTYHVTSGQAQALALPHEVQQRATACAAPHPGEFVEQAIVGFRERLLAEHLGSEPARVRQVMTDYHGFADDRAEEESLDAASRASLEDALRPYLDARGLAADWEAVQSADDEGLVTALAGALLGDYYFRGLRLGDAGTAGGFRADVTMLDSALSLTAIGQGSVIATPVATAPVSTAPVTPTRLTKSRLLNDSSAGFTPPNF